MPYDRDSFLAGLAVGRTLWRPHRDYGGNTFQRYPCFLMGVKVPVEWSRGSNDYVGLMFAQIDTSVWPNPAYWMLWKDLQDNEYILFFCPNGVGERQVGFFQYGCFADGTTDWVGSTFAGRFDYHEDSVLGKYRIQYAPTESYVTPLFSNYAHFIGNNDYLNSFFETATLSQVGSQLYVVGAV